MIKVNQHEYLSKMLRRRYKQWFVITSEDSILRMMIIDGIRAKYDLKSIKPEKFDDESIIYKPTDKLIFIFGPVNAIISSPSLNLIDLA